MIMWIYLCFFGTLVDAEFHPADTFPECFGVACRNNGTLDNATCTCQCPSGKFGFECDLDSSSEWPDDDFALPETVFGCPEPMSAAWRRLELNLVLQVKYSPDTRHYLPELPHYRGPFQKQTITMNFCVKRRLSTELDEDIANTWPAGNYCLYKQHPCPNEMDSDEIKLTGYNVHETSTSIDLVNFVRSVETGNSAYVELSVCCKTRQGIPKEMYLPRLRPFLLLKSYRKQNYRHTITIGWLREATNNSVGLLNVNSNRPGGDYDMHVTVRLHAVKLLDFSLTHDKHCMESSSKRKECQPIEGTEVKEEWFGFFANNQSTDETVERPLSLFHDNNIANLSYCFYKNYERIECIQRTDTGASYRGRLNVTGHSLSCLHWNQISGIVSSNVLEKNYCRKLGYTRTDMLACYAEIDDQQRKLDCGPEYCYGVDSDEEMAFMYKAFQNIAYRRPLTTNVKKAKLDGLVNGFSWRGSAETVAIFESATTYQPWVRIDLGARYLIHAVILYRKLNKCTYPNKWSNIAVWIHDYPLQFNSFGGQLCWEIEDLLNECNIEMRCVQALSGYYVTVQAFASALLEFNQPWFTKLNFEEIEIYGEATECGQYFGIGSGSFARYQVDLDKLKYIEQKQLHDPEGQCFIEQLIVNIDLLAISTVEGIALNFTTEMKGNLTVTFGRNTLSDSDDETLIFRAMDGSLNDFTVKYFRNRIFARLIQLRFTEPTIEKVCMTYDFIGCPKMILRDPLCSKKHPVIGMGVIDKRKTIGLPSIDIKGFGMGGAPNIAACELRCLETDNCISWSFQTSGNDCLLFTTTYLLEFSGRQSLLKQRGRLTWAAGEKVCLEGITPAHPCRFETILFSPVYVTSPSYPMPYSTNLRCTWKINFPNNTDTAIKITFFDLQFPAPEPKESLYEESTCVDFLSVGDREKRLEYRPHLILTYKNASSFIKSITYLEEEPYLLINFVSCERTIIWQQAVFSMKIEKSDCVGCRNYPSTCNNPRFDSLNACARSDCGYISTLNYLRPYGNNMVCRWLYRALYPVKIDFVHFDIPGGQRCQSDNLTLYTGSDVGLLDLTDWSVWKINGIYCNNQRPVMVMYINTDFGLELFTDDSIAGTGFLLRWRRLEYKIKAIYRPVSMETDGLTVLAANGIDTSGKETFFKDKPSFHFCTRRKAGYELYLEYPFICYMEDDESLVKNQAISWEQANRKCKEYGGKLVSIKNKQEDDLIRSLLEQSGANNSFIGLKRNHSTGQLYDEDKKKYLYMNWGFDDDVMSVEPNGQEESNCLMMKNLLESSGSSLITSWADVNCNQKYVALIVCEHPITLPWGVSTNKVSTDYSMDRNGISVKRSDLFHCGVGEYILSELQCDRIDNCLDGTDELECDYSVCPTNRLYCGDDEPRCVHLNLTCDFYNDCHNGADEIGCFFPECEEDKWRCLNGQCVPDSAKNDGVFDCVDESDEIIEGSRWHIKIQTDDIFDGGSSADVFIKVYSENATSQYIRLDRNLYRFEKGSTVSAETVIDIEEPTKIRVRHEVAVDESPLYLDRITMSNEEHGSFIFDCDCAIPDPSTSWIPFIDISANNHRTELPLTGLTTYNIDVRTGSMTGSGTLNKVYILLYGEKSDTGIFELRETEEDSKKLLFQTENADTFSYKTVDIGKVVMMKVFHFGGHIHDDWFLDKIIIQNSNSSVSFNFERWIGVNILDSNIGVTLLALGNEKPSYALRSRCQNKFECLDGQCIPESFYCDQVVHCRGPFHEDEPLICSPRHFRGSCLEVLAYSNSFEDYYDISFGNSAQVYKIHCAFGEDKYIGTVVSKVHTNLKNWIDITGGMSRTVVYYSDDIEMDDNGIEILKRNSEFCLQRIETKCLYKQDELYGSILLKDWNNVTYRPFAYAGFSCGEQCKAIWPSCFYFSCNCKKTIEEWYRLRHSEYNTDELFITDKTRLPIRNLGFILKDLNDLTHYQIRLHPLECFESLPVEKKFVCNNGEQYDSRYHCVLQYDKYGRPTACPDYTHVTDCETFQCPAGYVKCRAGFCIPLHYVCNGVPDCLQDEDEQDCNDKNTCIGALRCRNSPMCVASDRICDGTYDCPFEDDELLCMNSSRVIRSLTIQDSLKLNKYNFSNYNFLASLNLSSIGIDTIENHFLRGLRNLLVLDISNNDIKELEENMFADMSRLKKLIIGGNTNLYRINPGTFKGLMSMEELDLKNSKIIVVSTGTFDGLDSLKTLNLSNNHISTLQESAFLGLRHLKTLDLRGNKITEFSRGVFAGLDSLEHLISNLYLLCCIRPSTVPAYQCFPERNEFSSCDDLMRNGGLRAFVWIIGISALMGNVVAMAYRFTVDRASFKTGNGVLLTNLCLADFLIGLYMVIIGSADVHFRGKYVWNDIAWRGGFMCKLAGFISFMSNEVSGAILCLITFDRYVTIRFTLQRVGLTRNSAFVSCLVCWGIFTFLALVPLVGLPYFDEDFYTKSGVCLAHPLTTDRSGGWEYATAIFVFFNFFTFIFIAVGQALIFREIHKARRVMNVTQNRRDVAIARKLSLVVMTNFLCWFPVCIMGLLAMSGYVIDSEVYAWVAVFVLPLNSAANPLLYTLSSLASSKIGAKVKKLKPKKEKKLTENEEIEKLQNLYDQGVITLYSQPGVRTLARHVDEFPMKTIELIAVTKKLAEAVDFIHSLGYVIGPFTSKEIVLEVNKRNKICSVSFLAMPIYSDAIDDVGNDIGNLGLVIKRMLKIQKLADGLE